jgi:CRP/FNR family transcriptional regulator
MKEILRAIFPQLNDDTLLDDLSTNCNLVEFSKDEIILDQNQQIKVIPLITKGEVKIMRIEDSGAKLYLYSLFRGDICAMSISCCINQTKSNVMAISARDTEILAIPSRFMDDWIVKYHSWRSFIFNNYRKKFDEILDSLNSIAFLNLDERLERFLIIRTAKTNGILKNTHQEIADELNSSREVISRLLKQMETSGKIELKRNYIKIKLLK